MQVIHIFYTKDHGYRDEGNNKPIGLNGIEASVQYGYVEGDTWYPQDVYLDKRVQEANGYSYLYVVVPPFLDDTHVIALVQEVTPDVVAITPLDVGSSGMTKWKTTYHHKEQP